jgi:tRNA(Arg) A34 adenosine deaminase TadA
VKSGPSSNSLFRLPPWAILVARRRQEPIVTASDRMRFVIQLALTNVTARTGGPFGAAVFESHTGRLIAVGVNVVEPTNCSLAHAEVVALANSHRTLKHFDLGATGLPKLELVTSCEPCAMCYGAIIWSGIRKIVCAARASDATAIGFDEAPKPKNWVAELKKRSITVTRDLYRDEAITVFQRYRQTGGRLYNVRQKASRLRSRDQRR